MPRTRRTPNPPPAQGLIWPQRWRPFGRHERAGQILTLAVRATGRKLRAGHFDASGRAAAPVAVDPVAAALIACDRIARLIGRPEPADAPDAPAWVDVDWAAAVPVVRIHARGAVVQGEKISRALVGGRVQAVDQTTGVQRLFSLDALREACAHAKAALVGAGFQISAFWEVRATRQGGVAVIGLRRVSTPVRELAKMAR